MGKGPVKFKIEDLYEVYSPTPPPVNPMPYLTAEAAMTLWFVAIKNCERLRGVAIAAGVDCRRPLRATQSSTDYAQAVADTNVCRFLRAWADKLEANDTWGKDL